MSSYRTILLCFDGSREGRKALKNGANLAADLRAQTHLLAVVDIRASFAESTVGLVPGVAERLESSTRSILNEGVDWLALRGVKAQSHLAYGVPVEEISRMAEKIQADLVVVGHRRRHGVARWWGGSSSATLLDRLSCSLLVSCCETGGVPALSEADDFPEEQSMAAGGDENSDAILPPVRESGRESVESIASSGQLPPL